MTDTRTAVAKRLYVGHDLGTGGDKAALVDLDGNVLATAFEPYELSYPGPNQVEQDPADYWRAVGTTTKKVIAEAGVAPSEIAGIGFAAQMLTMVPLDRSGRPTRPAISWLDSRADEQARKLVRRLGGGRVVMALAGAIPSGKDIVCKLAWLRAHEPDVFDRTVAFCDATGYLVAQATGELIADDTAAGGTGLLNRKTREWDRVLVTVIRAPRSKLPTVHACADVIGGLTENASEDLGLLAGTPVIAGLGDVPAAQVGSGSLGVGDAHLCLGTSGWLCVTVDKPKDLGRNGVFSLPAADPGLFAMVGEMETAGECLDWFVDHLGHGASHADLLAAAADVGPGAEGLLFMPWMFGERSPVTDTTVRGAFVNLSLGHRHAHMVRAILEGVGFNLRWVLEVMEKAGHPCPTIRAIGGGSRSDLWLQIIADITGRRILAVAESQSVGAVGAALTTAVGLGDLPGYGAIGARVQTDRSFTPDRSALATYNRHYSAFRGAYPGLSTVGQLLNSSP
jgi:xylulokinase